MKKNDSNLFYTCSLIELIGRSTRQKRKDVVKLMGEKTIRHIYHHADTLHCEPIAKIADYYIDFCHIPTGEFDNIASCKYSVPSYWEIGKVYARLIEDIQKDDVIFALIRVYNSTVSDSISYYNSDFFYQPRGFIKEQFLSEENAVSGETSKKPAIRFRGFTDAWEQRKLGEIVSPYSDPVPTPHDGYWRVGIRSHAKGTFQEYVPPGQELGSAKMHKVKENNLIVNITFAWEHAVAITTDHDANKLVSHRFPQFSFSSEMLPAFFKYVVLDENFRQHLFLASPGGAGRNRVLKIPAMLEYFMVVPKKEEQKKINAFFRNLDYLITLHQRKHEKLGSIKKALLEKMFPKNGTKFPEIRFSGFTDAWEQRKLREIVERVVRKNTNNESTLPLTISAQYGLVDQITYFNNRVASRDISNYYLVLNGEFAYNKSTSDGFPFGAVKRLDLYPKGVLSTLYIVFSLRDQEQISSDFLSVFFDTDRWHRGVAERAAEGARNHGLLNISTEDFFDIDLRIPKEKREQDKIGALFRGIDHLITLHQRELEKLRNIKKACLEKMFV